MGFPLKRILLFLSTVLLIGAPPAQSVPLSSGMGSHEAVYGASSTDSDGEAIQNSEDGTAERADARIVDHTPVTYAPHSEVAMGGSASMGSSGHSWALPAAGIGVGGAVLFAVLSHDSHGGDPASSAAPSASSSLGGPASGGGPKNNGGNGDSGSSGGNDPPTVPEPGTLLMLGAGIASFLGRKKILSH
jgi:hypothetical protein